MKETVRSLSSLARHAGAKCLLLGSIFLLMLGIPAAHAWDVTDQAQGTNYITVTGSFTNNIYYVAYNITNETANTITNIWVKLGTFTNGPGAPNINPAPGSATKKTIPPLLGHTFDTVFFCLKATNTTTSATNAIGVYIGDPDLGGVLQTNKIFTTNMVVACTTAANGSSVSSVSVSTASPTLGSWFTLTTSYTVGSSGKGGVYLVYPAVSNSWDAASFALISNTITYEYGAGVFTNVNDTFSFLAGGGSGQNKTTLITNVATYLVISPKTSTTTVSPGGYVNTGGASAHDYQLSTAIAVSPIPGPTNSIILTNWSSATRAYTNTTVYFTNRFYNTATNDSMVNDLVATLPRGFIYAGNPTFNGQPIAAPSTNSASATNYQIVFSEGYSIRGLGSNDLVFSAIPTNCLDSAGVITNRSQLVLYSSYGLVGTNYITTSFTNQSQLPTNQVTVLLNPLATNDAYSATFGSLLSLTAASGVLSNDYEPNSLAFGVASNTAARYGSLAISNNGGFTYTGTNRNIFTNATPVDSFTYYATNSDGRVASASVSISIAKAQAAFTGLSSQSINYGTASVTISGTIGAANVYPTNGEVVRITINGTTITAPITAGTGAFSTSFSTATIPYSATPYTIVCAYATDDALLGTTNSTYTLTVNRSPLTITANNDNKTYGQTKTYGSGSTAYSITSGSLQNGDAISSLTITASGGTTAGAAVGSYSLTPSAPVFGSGSTNNYNITYNAGTLTVGALAVIATGSKTYNGNTTINAANLAVSNIVGSDTVNFASGSGTLSAAGVGTRSITAFGTLTLGGSSAANYTLTGATGTVTVNAATATYVSGLTANDKTADGTTTATINMGTVILSGIVGSDSGNVSLSTNGYSANFSTASAGTNLTVTVSNLTLTGSAAANYTLVQPVLLHATISPGAIDHFFVTYSAAPYYAGQVYTTYVYAMDANNNVVHTNISVSLTSSSTNVYWDANGDGTYGQISPESTPSLSNGVAVVNSKSAAAQDNVTTTASSGILTGTSVAIDFDLLSGSYRTIASGDWANTNIWEVYDGVSSNWVKAVKSPDYTDGVIDVQPGHIVQVTNALTVDQVHLVGEIDVVASGSLTVTSNSFPAPGLEIYGVLDNRGMITFTNGSSSFVDSRGLLKNAGSISSSASSLAFIPGDGDGPAVYEHWFTATGGNIPLAAWQSNSLCRVLGYTSNTSAPGNLSQTFYDLQWACTNQASAISLTGLAKIADNFTALNTGSGSVTLTANLTVTNTTTVCSNAFLDCAGSVLSGGSFYLDAGGTLGIGSTVGIVASGNTGSIQTSVRSFDTGADYVYDGASTSQVTGNALPATVHGLIIANTASSNPSVALTGNVTVTSALKLLSGSTVLNNKLLSLADGAAITVDVGTAPSALTFGNSVDVTYVGTSAVATGNEIPAGSTTLRNLTVNKSGGVSLGTNVVVNGTLTLTSGSFAVGAYSLTLNGPAIAGTAANLSTTANSSLTLGGSEAGVTVPSSVTALLNLTNNNSAHPVVLAGGMAITTNLVLASGSVLGLASNTTNTCGSLWFDGVPQLVGNWGSTASSANRKSLRFGDSSSGILKVGVVGGVFFQQDATIRPVADSKVAVQFYGAKGLTYIVQRATTLTPSPDWADYATIYNTTGATNYIDPNPPQNGAFYRLKWVP